MMSCQIKHSVCQWHTIHRVLVSRFSSTGQQQSNNHLESNHRVIQTQPCDRHTLCAISAEPSTRHSQQTLHTTNCIQRTFLSVPDVNTRVVHRCLSTTPPNAASKKDSKSSKKYKHNPLTARTSRYVLTPELASLLVDKIWNWDSVSSESTQSLIIDVNPGPGHVVKELLNRGASKVLAVERKIQFMSDLHQLAENSNGRVTAMHANYFKPSQINNATAPCVVVEDIFKDVQPQPWDTTDPKFPVNVVGALPAGADELKHASALVRQLLYRNRAFSYGCVQHNLFMSEKMYRKMIQEPGHRLLYYTSLSAMYQLCCHVKLLHMEPKTSFFISKTPVEKPENLCLVQLTPKVDFFERGLLAEEHAYLFIHFLIQMLVNRKTSLKDKIEGWAPGHSDIIFDFNYNLKTKTGELSGTDYLHLFNAIRKVDTFSEWMGTHFYNTLQRNNSENKDYEDLLDRIELDGVTDVDDDHMDAAALS
ncbi:dimethyladenosine transferase 2, mitochondrial-like [Amphiura filiformis]|uniref:dimethyladenosine transferase 2, mitochondrial-like n=1 Tax=Amphiura filiformis TaxID=82378 RepID=UPI003B2242FE